MDGYARFIADNQLALSPMQETLPSEPATWDWLHIARLTESTQAGSEIPPVFAMFNEAKSQYLLSRRMLFEAGKEVGESTSTDAHLYMDTLDYAIFSEAAAKMVAAQKLAADILDKIACAVNEWLSLHRNVTNVYFTNTFVYRGKRTRLPQWEKKILPEMNEGNTGLLALADLAADVSFDGHLEPLRLIRHAGTHRFLVLHDIAVGDSRASAAVEHHLVRDFTKEAISTLRVVRAALLYLLQAIEVREARNPGGKNGSPKVSTIVPRHSDIRR